VKPNPECPKCSGTGYPNREGPAPWDPCDCWRNIPGYVDNWTLVSDGGSGHDEAHDDRGRLDEVESKYGGDREEEL
jgi:hypothetical protein